MHAASNPDVSPSGVGYSATQSLPVLCTVQPTHGLVQPHTETHRLVEINTETQGLVEMNTRQGLVNLNTTQG